jgi:ubiquinone/menaquinone biosynthesis C-methylase UbiE
MAGIMLNTFQQSDHPVLPRTTHDERSRQEFSKSLKNCIQQKILPGLKTVYEQRAAKNFEKREGRAPAHRRDIRKAMERDLYFQHYNCINRVAQELIWESVTTSIERQLPELIDTARALSATSKGTLTIDPDFKPPRYATALDIHCMPGGYADEFTQDDVAVGALYDRGVYLYAMGFIGPYNDDMGRSVCNYLQRNLQGFEPTRILDMGCSVGHSTVPYKERFPNAEVYGLDIGAPLVRYAHARAKGLGHDVNFLVGNAEQTDFEDESFDLIVSHILLHETSGKAMPRIFKECYRLLKPGGVMIHADLPPFTKMDTFSQFILDLETYYNNEPFWGAMREADQVELAEKAGFQREDVAFDTAPMAIMELAAAAQAGNVEAALNTDSKEFKSGEFAPGGGWEVLIGHKPKTSSRREVA